LKKDNQNMWKCVLSNGFWHRVVFSEPYSATHFIMLSFARFQVNTTVSVVLSPLFQTVIKTHH